MVVGELHTFNGGQYSFIETLGGPLRESACNDCGAPAAVVIPTGRIGAGSMLEDQPPMVVRCSGCGRRYHGLAA